MRRDPWQSVSERTDQLTHGVLVIPTRILAALHVTYSKRFHLWHDGRRLILTEIQDTWRPRVYIYRLPKPSDPTFLIGFPPSVSQLQRLTWFDWFVQQFAYDVKGVKLPKPQTIPVQPASSQPTPKLEKLVDPLAELYDQTSAISHENYFVHHAGIVQPLSLQTILRRNFPGWDIRANASGELYITGMIEKTRAWFRLKYTHGVDLPEVTPITMHQQPSAIHRRYSRMREGIITAMALAIYNITGRLEHLPRRT